MIDQEYWICDVTKQRYQLVDGACPHCGHRVDDEDKTFVSCHYRAHIVCAAMCFPDGTVIASARHWDRVVRGLIDTVSFLKEKEDLTNSLIEQGFIDTRGNFHNRADALDIVLTNGQPFDAERNGSKDKLYSEGLY